MKTQYNTSRLLLDELSAGDSSFIISLLNSPGWLKFIGERNVKTNEDAINYIQKIRNNPNVTYWVVRLKDSSEQAGVITLIKRDYLDHSDIGFALLPEYSGKGIAAEAAKAVLDDLIKSGDHKTIHAITVKENFSSIHLLEKLGLVFEKVIANEGEELLLYSLYL